MKRHIFLSLLIPLFFGAVSCVNPPLEDALDSKNHFRNVADAQASIRGLYGKFMELAEKVVVLNELRADLMDVTPNADESLQAISYFTSDRDNAWSDPTIFYEFIQNCNDALANFDRMKRESRFSDDEYNEFYSDVMTMRCWVYLRLGALYGSVPYLTEPLADVDDVRKLKAEDYRNIDELVPALIASMEALPTLEQYTAASGLNTVQDGYSLSYYSLNKRCLLMELYLWNDQYEQCAKVYRDFLRQYESEGGDGRYKNKTYVYQGSFDGSFMVTYTRNMYSDYNSMVNLWVKMFELKINERYANHEHITCLTYDKSFAPTYPFIRLFATEGLGEYLLMPSKNVVENYWNAQVQTNGFEFDGRGKTGAYVIDEQGRYVIRKYLSDYDLTKPYEQTGRWFVYRSGWLNLLYAEACNRLAESGQCYMNDPLRPYTAYRKLAYGMLNNGIKAQFRWRRPDGKDCRGDSTYVTGWWAGESGNFPEPFYFDCRQNDKPYHRGPWRDGNGMRARASLTNKVWDNTSNVPEVEFLENAILEELALETAFEGHRWMDIIRIARRQNRLESGKGTALLNDLMKKKFEANGQVAPVFLDDESNWYLPVRFE